MSCAVQAACNVVSAFVSIGVGAFFLNSALGSVVAGRGSSTFCLGRPCTVRFHQGLLGRKPWDFSNFLTLP